MLGTHAETARGSFAAGGPVQRYGAGGYTARCAAVRRRFQR
jgi:hypothetical protein